jgi:4-amino-4-deoxy-L-arabinose transferase-like glycosyltransferase
VLSIALASLNALDATRAEVCFLRGRRHPDDARGTLIGPPHGFKNDPANRRSRSTPPPIRVLCRRAAGLRMSTTDPTRLRSDDDGLPSPRVWVALVLLFAALTLVPVFREPVVRTQEARVLETARQMLDADWRGWLLPQLNGEPRLRKPPLCYWYTAASFELFGSASEWAGRMPALLIAWASVGVTYLFGRDLGGRRLGFYAAAIFASGTLFLRFARSTETDVPAMLGVLVAFRAIVAATRPDASRGRSVAQFHLAAIGTAFAALSKGGPGTFPIVFLALLAIAERSWRPIVGFLRSGAPLTAVALVVPWFAYVALAPGGEQVREEVGVVLGGSNHFGLFYEYFGPLALAVAPWTGWFLLALVAAWQTRRTPDPARRVALLGLAAVGLPLAVALNVQRHYLVPILPMASLLTAWFVTRLTARPGEAPGATIDPRLAEASRWVLAVTVIALCVVAIGVAAVDVRLHGARPDLWAWAGAASIAAAAAWLIARRRHDPPHRQLAAFAAAMAWALPAVIGLADTSDRDEPMRPTVAAARSALAARFDGETPGPFLMAAGNASVTMSYYLRASMRAADDPALIDAFLEEHPRGVVVIERSQEPDAPTPATLPAGLSLVYAGRTDRREVAEFYVRGTPATTQPTATAASASEP